VYPQGVSVPSPSEPDRLARVSAEAAGARMDFAVHAALRSSGVSASVSEVRKALRAGQIRVDGRSPAPGSRARGGENVDWRAFTPRSAWALQPRLDLLASNPKIDEGEGWIALAKQAGLPTLPLRGPDDPALLLAAIAAAPDIASAGPPGEGGAVHRLDNDTSGVVVFARNREARSRLRSAFTRHELSKGYEALVPADVSIPTEIRGRIETTGGPRVRVRPLDAVEEGPRCRVRRLEANGGVARVEVTTSWGSRHLVRALLARVGAPLLHDELYGGRTEPRLGRLALHATWIEIDGRRIEHPSGWAGLEAWSS